MEGAFDGLNAGEDDGDVVAGGGVDASHVEGEAIEDPIFLDVRILVEFLFGFSCDVLAGLGDVFEFFSLRSSGMGNVAGIFVNTFNRV